MRFKLWALPLMAGLLLLTACANQLGTLVPELIDPYTYEPKAPTAANLNLAAQYYEKGDYENAARYFMAHLNSKPDDANAWYNLSCCFGLLGRGDLAGKYLMRAYKAGFTDIAHVKQDKDFEKVRDNKDFGTAMDSLRVWSERQAWYEGEMKYISSTHLMPYWLHLPQKFSQNQSYTLVIGLHGFGDKAKNFSRMWKNLETDNVIFAVPEAPYPFTDSFAGFSWSPWLEMDDPQSAQADAMLEEYILDLCAELGASYNISSVWLFGFSQGAYTGYILGIRNPQVFDGLIACGGGLLEQYLTKDQFNAARNLKVIVSHGRQDTIVAYAEADKAMKALTAYDFPNVHLDSFEGGHEVSPTAFEKFRAWKNK